MTTSVYEVEYKVEIDLTEKALVLKSMISHDVEQKTTTLQKDYYTVARQSPFYDIGGSYDVERYRNDNGAYIHTEKIWELVDGELARLEKERTLSKSEFDKAINDNPAALKIEKTRNWHLGTFNNNEFTITIDSVKFDHSPEERYFLEVEICVQDKNQMKQARENVQSFLRLLLNKNELAQAAGMFKMAYEKV
jgi:adenylate cyclase class IV